MIPEDFEIDLRAASKAHQRLIELGWTKPSPLEPVASNTVSGVADCNIPKVEQLNKMFTEFGERWLMTPDDAWHFIQAVRGICGNRKG